MLGTRAGKRAQTGGIDRQRYQMQVPLRSELVLLESGSWSARVIGRSCAAAFQFPILETKFFGGMMFCFEFRLIESS